MACGQIVLNIKNTFSATFAQTKCLAAILLIIEKIRSVSVTAKYKVSKKFLQNGRVAGERRGVPG